MFKMWRGRSFSFSPLSFGTARTDASRYFFTTCPNSSPTPRAPRQPTDIRRLPQMHRSKSASPAPRLIVKEASRDHLESGPLASRFFPFRYFANIFSGSIAINLPRLRASTSPFSFRISAVFVWTRPRTERSRLSTVKRFPSGTAHVFDRHLFRQRNHVPDLVYLTHCFIENRGYYPPVRVRRRPSVP